MSTEQPPWETPGGSDDEDLLGDLFDDTGTPSRSMPGARPPRTPAPRSQTPTAGAHGGQPPTIQTPAGQRPTTQARPFQPGQRPTTERARREATRVSVVDAGGRAVEREVTGRARPKRRGGRLTLSSGLLGGAIVAMAVGSFLVLQSFAPWMTLFDDDAPPAAPPAVAAEARVVETDGRSPAQRVVAETLAFVPPGLEGRANGDVTDGLTSASFGFGCDPKDGVSPAVGASRGFIDGPTNLTIAAWAYPAGAGSVAMDGLRTASLACEAASLATPAATLGVETTQIVSARQSALVWRRGDVLMVATIQTSGRAGDPVGYLAEFVAYDDALSGALGDECVNPESDLDDAVRSPYLTRAKYEGFTVTETVDRPASSRPPAEETSTFPPVPVPAPERKVPEAPERPEAPSPPPTRTVAALPREVAAPVLPRAPQKPDLSGEVERSVEDTDGPGCGWAFTGQAVPAFDAQKAEQAYAKDRRAAERVLKKRWATWQRAREDYFKAYATYLLDVADYRRYSEEVSEIAAKWAVIEEARANYFTALANWEEAVAAAEQFDADQAAARAAYQQNRKDCRTYEPPEPQPPKDDPSTPRDESKDPPKPVEDPDAPVCPAPRPEILDQERPFVPDEPVPPRAAELPKTK